MKKVFCVSLLIVSLLSSVSFGQMIYGARAAGMGGVGVTTSQDMFSAYYNPAGIVKTGSVGFQGSLGASYNGLDKLVSSFAAAADPTKFVVDNYSSDINVDGNITSLIGFKIKNFGLSVLPTATLNFSKPKDSIVANGSAVGTYNGVLTVGHNFPLSVLPDVSVGLNLKYIGGADGTLTLATLQSGAAVGSKTWDSRSGFGLDIGALTTIKIPFITSLSAGIVARDLFETVNVTAKQQSITATPGSTDYTYGDIVILGTTSETVKPSYVAGVSGTIPVIGLLVAADYEMKEAGSNTHFGIEYPVLLNVFALRAGYMDGIDVQAGTFGVRVAAALATLNAALTFDSKDSRKNTAVIDFGMII